MDSELYHAVINDDVDVLKELEGRLSIDDQRTPTDSTVLHLACHYGSINCVKEILNMHESLLLKIDSRGETVLHLAAREGHYDVVEILISTANSSLLQPENTSSTVIQFLIRLPNVEFETALHVAVRNNHYNVIELLVKQDPTHPHPRNMYDETPLYLACIRGDARISQTILDHCDSPTFGGPEGRTALHAAVLDSRDGRMRNLIEKNKDLVKIADDYGWTVFHYMSYFNHHSLVEYLVGADKSAAYLADKECNRTALHIAAYRGNVDVLKELVKYIPDSLEIVDAFGRNILHIAAIHGQKEVIRFILSQGDKTSKKLLMQRDKEGNTPLHLIAKFECHVQELMDVTTLDWEVLNNRNLTPLDLLDGTLPDQITLSHKNMMIRKRLVDDLSSRQHWHLWRTLKDPDGLKLDIEKGTKVVTHKEKMNKEAVEFYNKIINTHMIVAALIVTVALTAGFTMPGGFDGNQGPTQGSAVLVRKSAFRAFIVTDSIALLFSISSLFLYFNTPFYQNADVLGIMVIAATMLNLFSLIAIMLAFITGTYAVLGHSPGLAISICVISSFFFPLVYFVFWRLPSKVL